MRTLGLAVLVSILTAAAAAGEVRVTPEAAWRGAFGLRADVVRSCPTEVSVLVLGPIVTVQTVEACDEVFVGDARVEAGGRLEAVAGRRVVLGSGFSVEAGGELVLGTAGGWDAGRVLETAPEAEPRIFVRAYVRLDAVALGDGGTLSILGLEDGSRLRGEVRYQEGDGGGRIWVEAREDDTSERVSERGWLSTGWHRLELEWDAGPVITPEGRVVLSVDGVEVARLDGLNLGLALIDTVVVGAWNGSGTGGWVDFDEVAASRTAPVGPAG